MLVQSKNQKKYESAHSIETWNIKEHKRALWKYNKINLRINKESKHVDIKSNFDQCENKATQKCHLSVHKQSKHEGIIIDCDQCEHKAKHKGSLRLHKQ